jgi:hypothetical protein
MVWSSRMKRRIAGATLLLLLMASTRGLILREGPADKNGKPY